MLNFLYDIIVSPIELCVEFVFELMFRLVGHAEKNQGLAVICVSIAISIMTLPLYRRADQVQQKERDIQKKLSSNIKRIKETFKGDERFMILQAFYRENKYNPLSSLNGSISLLLEIPFFIAAYHFLSHLEVLQNASFGFINNLGLPDSLINTSLFTINVLPILMTIINCISSAIYLKGFSIKNKLQVYGMALIFLVLLYDSPSGLVIYWTCNNLFSLIKNILYKLKNPRRVLNILLLILGIIIPIILILSGIINSRKKYSFVILFMILMILPTFINRIKKNTRIPSINIQYNSTTSLYFLLSACLLVIITGLLIPGATIVSSPADFIDINNYQNPLHFLQKPFCYAVGFFLLWASIIYRMLTKQGKYLLSLLFSFLAISGIINYMVFSRKLGTISSMLVFDSEPIFSLRFILLNLIVCLLIFLVILLINNKKAIFTPVLSVLSFGVFGLVIMNIWNTQLQLKEMTHIKTKNQENSDLIPVLSLSKTGKNVIVIMLDGAVSSFFPLCIDEKPILKKQFEGFTYYPNMLSYGTKTLFGSTAIFGGYDYTIKELEKRNSVSMREKHNEALKLMPTLFSNNGYTVTICDVPYANYQLIPDLSIYDSIPEVKTHILKGKYTNIYLKTRNLVDYDHKRAERAFFCYSIFNIAPVFIKNTVYDDGNYYDSNKGVVTRKFIDNYSVLDLMPKLTNLSASKNTFTLLGIESTHEPCYLYTPNYDIVASENKEKQKATSYNFKSSEQIKKYNINMASYLKLGDYFDFLRKNDVFDNTRIIIVADHGHRNTKNGAETVVGLKYFDFMTLKTNGFEFDVDSFNPLLLVKDFYSNKLTTVPDFMTTADVPTLATREIIENPINPFTKNPISSDDKKNPQIVTCSLNYDIPQKDVPMLDLSDGKLLSVHDNIFNSENWRIEN